MCIGHLYPPLFDQNRIKGTESRHVVTMVKDFKHSQINTNSLSDPTRSKVVNIFQTELMVKIYSKNLVRAIG